MNRKILAISTIVLLLDQLSKGLIDAFLNLGETIPVIKNFFNIHYINNYGAAWSILEGKNYIIIAFTFVALIIIYRYMYSFKRNKRNNIAFGLLTGGIVGNLIDRVFFGHVRDFFEFNIFGYDFPIFNISDIAIVLGIFLLIIAIFKGEDERDKNTSRK